MSTYYHVAGPAWRPGDPLYSFEQRVLRGEADIADWRWSERPYGDGSESWVFLFEHFEDAIEFAESYGGTMLEVADPGGSEGPRIDLVEGYPYVFGPIPADLLAVVP